MKLEKCKKKKKGKKGQITIGALFVAFIGIIVGVSLFLSVAQTVGTTTSTVSVANKSLGAVASNSTAQYFTDYVNLADVVIYNATGNVLVPSTNYTITNHVVYNGAEVVKIQPNALPANQGKWQISGTAQAQNYIADSGSRAIAGVIILLAAIAIAVAAMSGMRKIE